MDNAETINDHFTNVAQVLAQDISVVDVSPKSYLEPTNHSFSLQIPSVDITDLKQTWTASKRTAYQAEETWN